MKKPNLVAMRNAVTSKAGINVLKLKKQSPNIMFGVGVVGVVATVVLASRATLKVEDLLDEHEENAEMANSSVGKMLTSGELYTERDRKQDLTKNTISTGLKLVKLYGPAFIVGAASIGCLTGAHVALNRRNAGLMAAYAAVDTAFKEYRERVVTELGEDKDREFAYGVDTREVYSEGKKGEPVVDHVKTAAHASKYARFFDESNLNHEVSPEHNIFFLKAQQTYANQRLQANGYLMLNDVYDALGLERSSEGQIVGWLKDNPKGDGRVDFGIWDDESMERFYDFMTGREKSILLDFNVDGVVYDQLNNL